MMLINVIARDELSGLARAKARDHHAKTINNKLIEDEIADGWIVQKRGTKNSRVTKDKNRPTLLEDRVWTLLFRMGLPYLSGEGGAKLLLQNNTDGEIHNQLDVVAIDSEVALAFECKSAEKVGKRPQFQQELAKFAAQRERFIRAVNATPAWKADGKRVPVMAFFLENIALSENDKERAREANVLVFTDADLEYYEKLVSHLGPAAKYQFFADAAPGRVIGGLSIRVPAVKTKMGGSICYTFPVSPEYLLKIAYVSHRAKGKASDINTYQRMISKSRLSKVRDYISQKGIFPTNIVLNIEKKHLTFQRIKQENSEEEQSASGTLGWLDIRPAYKSAWVIDGQHRLFAYSGHPRAATSHLSVLAFEGLSPSMQAGLFVDINAKQKSVKQSLLEELHAELHWDSDSVITRVQAIVSKMIRQLDADPASPLYGRILTADVDKDSTRCISFTSAYRAVAKTKHFVLKESKGAVVQYGPLWRIDNIRTLKRLNRVVNAWLSPIAEVANDWWSLGSGEGGGLAMNDGVAACMLVFDSVIEHLERSGMNLVQKEDEDFSEIIHPFATEVGVYLASLSPEKRKSFRDLRGVQGQTVRMRQIQLALKKKFRNFDPPGLDHFFQEQSAETNIKAKRSIDRIEKTVQSIVVQELKQNFRGGEDAWWFDGLPRSIRTEVSKRLENDDNKRGAREAYLDFIDYREIAHKNWAIFQNVVGYGKKNDKKEKQTHWMVEVNEWRNIVAHASSGRSVPVDDLGRLQGYENWIRSRLNGSDVGPFEPEEQQPDDAAAD